MIATWYVEAGKYDVLPVDSRGTQRLAEPRPQIAVDRDELHLLPGHADGSDQRLRQCVEPVTQHHRRCRDSQGRRRRRAALGRRCPGRLFASTCRTASSTTSTTTSGANSITLNRTIAVPGGPPQAALRVRGDRQAGHQVRARGRRAAPSFTSTASLSDRVTFLSRCHSPLGLPAASSAAPTAGSPVWDKYKPPFKFSGTLYSATVDVSGELIKDDEATLRMHLARQ